MQVCIVDGQLDEDRSRAVVNPAVTIQLVDVSVKTLEVSGSQLAHKPSRRVAGQAAGVRRRLVVCRRILEPISEYWSRCRLAVVRISFTTSAGLRWVLSMLQH